MEIEDVALGEELHDSRPEHAEVRAGVFGGLGTAVTGDVQDLAQPQVGVLG